MANKKITVLGDIGDPSLTPDETHKIEVRIDKMMAINEPESAPEPPAEQPHEAKVIEPLHQDLAVDEPAPVVEEEPVAPVPKPKTKIPITMVDDESEAMPPSAPPLVKMPKPAKKVSIVQDTVEDKETELLAPSELPDTPLQIDIGAPELTIVPSAEENENDEPLDEPLADEAPLDNQEPLAPKPDDGEKKYRPPDGPLPFKRAEPAETEDASQNATPTLNAQQAEDEAITKAFAAQDAARHKKPRSKAKLRRASKVGLVLVALLLVAGAAAFAVPSVRHKLIGMNDKQSSTPTTSVTPKQATAAVAATQPTGYDVYMAAKTVFTMCTRLCKMVSRSYC